MLHIKLNSKYQDNIENYPLRQTNGKRLVGIALLFIVLCTMFIGVRIILEWIQDTKQLSLSKLAITGERFYTSNEDIHQSILALGLLGTFITQDITIIQKKIKSIPWVKQVCIRKQWPDKIKIHLVEYIPIARWNNQYMVDMDGNFFSIPTDRINNKNFPILYGPESSKNEVLQGFRTIEEILKNNNLFLKEVIMTNRHTWRLRLVNGIKLNLGRKDITNRLMRFIEFYPMIVQQIQTTGKQINYIDLRYNFGAAISWTPVLLKEPN